MSDDEREDAPQVQDDADWTYVPPPHTQASHYFKIDGLLFDSKFDSGNLMDVERLGPYMYNLTLSRDCEGSPKQTSNKQWFHFSISGGLKGHTIQLTITNIPCCKMYSFAGYAPCVAIAPVRPSYSRLNSRINIRKLTPVPVQVASPTSESFLPVIGNGTPTADSGIFTFDSAAATGAVPAAAPKKPTTMCNMTFEYTFEVDSLLKLDVDPVGAEELPSSYTTTTYIANAHPYPYAKLQKHLAAWDSLINGPVPCTSVDQVSAGGGAGSSGSKTSGGATRSRDSVPNKGEIYYHRELLTWSLDGNRCDLLTISGMNGMAPTTSGKNGTNGTAAAAAPPVAGGGGGGKTAESYSQSSSDCYEPMLDVDIPVPMAQCRNPSTGRGNNILDSLPVEQLADRCCPNTGRAKLFPKKKYVILSARVHPGEIPASHLLHGALEFLVNKTDPRAEQLRQHFVFVIVPCINPDGVVRGHSRSDTTGQNLNRTYANPSPKRHPTVYALKKLLLQLESTKRLALFIDLHAHANKRGMFFYGNAMKAQEQIQNLLYAKVVSINTPYFEFQNCNFSEQNMNAVGKNGESKDSSSRVVLFKETGFIHSYTLESNYVCGTTLNEVKGLGASFPGEEGPTLDGAPSPKYSYQHFHDVGRALCVSVLDMHNLNVASRLPLSGYHNLKNVALWIQKTLVTDAWEQQRRQSVLQAGQSLAKEREKGLPTFSTMSNAQFPEYVTTKANKIFPAVTVQDLTLAAKNIPKEDAVPGKGGNVAPAGVTRKPFETTSANNSGGAGSTSALGAKKTSGVIGRSSSGTTAGTAKKTLTSRAIPPPAINSPGEVKTTTSRRGTNTVLGIRGTSLAK